MSKNRKFIESDFDKIREIYDLSDRHIFAIWILSKLHFQGDFSENTLSEVYEQTHALLSEEGKGDSNLDGFFYDEDATTLYLYQAKWPDKQSSKPGIESAREVANALTMLSHDLDNLKSIKVPDARREAIRTLQEVLKENGKIVLRGVCGSEWNANHVEAVQKCVPSIYKKMVSVELLGVQKLYELISEQTEDLKGKKIDFSLYNTVTVNPILEYPSTGAEGLSTAVVALISGKCLAKIARDCGQRIFEANVRKYLGRTGRVNKDMEATLDDSESRKFFWYGHNGITILCDDYTPSKKDKHFASITITNPQIVNGCQTATTLAKKVVDENSKILDFAILARIIKLNGNQTERNEAAELIAYRTNNQSAVNDADLRANDEVQKYIQKILHAYNNCWFYERKRGEWSNLPASRKGLYKSPKEAYRIIERDMYQQAWRSYTGTPHEAITQKNAVWVRKHGSSGDLYEFVFNKNRRACDVVLVAVLYDWFARLFSIRKGSSLCFEINKSLKSYADDLPRAKMLVAAHSIALFGYLVKNACGDVEKYGENNVNKILHALDRGNHVRTKWQGKKSWAIFEKSVKIIMQTWVQYLMLLKQTDQSLYVALKTTQSHEQLKQILESILSGEDYNSFVEIA